MSNNNNNSNDHHRLNYNAASASAVAAAAADVKNDDDDADDDIAIIVDNEQSASKTFPEMVFEMVSREAANPNNDHFQWEQQQQVQAQESIKTDTDTDTDNDNDNDNDDNYSGGKEQSGQAFSIRTNYGNSNDDSSAAVLTSTVKKYLKRKYYPRSNSYVHCSICIIYGLRGAETSLKPKRCRFLGLSASIKKGVWDTSRRVLV